MSSKKNDTRTKILKTTWHLMEQHSGQGVRMSDIAKAAGISRQALYLHFTSKKELIIATVHYVDEVKGLNERLRRFQMSTTGVELLETCVEIWGNYIPEVYGLAKVLLNTRETDEATAAAWSNCMTGLRDVCQKTIDTLDSEGNLSLEWSRNEAIEMFWTIISIQNWEQLTIECGWSTTQYIDRIKMLLKGTFVNSAEIVE